MTDQEIVLALQCCNGYGEGCHDCPLYNLRCDSGQVLTLHALNLIEKQQKEIKELKQIILNNN